MLPKDPTRANPSSISFTNLSLVEKERRTFTMRKQFFTLTVLLALLLALAACGGATAEPTTAPEEPAVEEPVEEEPVEEEPVEEEPAAEGGQSYVLVPKNLGNPYFDTANTGAQEAAQELGVEVTYQGSSVADATEQIQLLNSLIAQGVNGLAISANDADALVPTGSTAIAEGIPVVTWDSAIAPGGRTVHINQALSEDIGRGQIRL